MRFLSSKVHTIIGVIIGIILLFAPNVFGMANDAAATVARFVGIFIILSELVTTSSVSPLKLVPMRVHLVLDYVTGVFLALSPWLFGFGGAQMSEWVPHLIVGILVVGYALVTDPQDDNGKMMAM
ncbi:SPW repeat protein [Streptomyces caniscabiei]|uniref:SPW repeat protein n=1 Tax=Streptomyces caniscabiei TaxID=2746961 RepID=UPI0029B16182|nr:SPW repeat protein [Streptomyces caniscabiei]MDX2776582.1 SPW repeat protein [Streptomyces caniscabiei]